MRAINTKVGKADERVSKSKPANQSPVFDKLSISDWYYLSFGTPQRIA
jgi:hypothetical protein